MSDLDTCERSDRSGDSPRPRNKSKRGKKVKLARRRTSSPRYTEPPEVAVRREIANSVEEDRLKAAASWAEAEAALNRTLKSTQGLGCGVAYDVLAEALGRTSPPLRRGFNYSPAATRPWATSCAQDSSGRCDLDEDAFATRGTPWTRGPLGHGRRARPKFRGTVPTGGPDSPYCVLLSSPRSPRSCSSEAGSSPGPAAAGAAAKPSATQPPAQPPGERRDKGFSFTAPTAAALARSGGFSAPSGARAAAHANGAEKKAKQLQERAASSASCHSNVRKNQLRVKIAQALKEVRTRQELLRSQEHVRKIREARSAEGRTLSRAGDLCDGTVGLASLAQMSPANPEGLASPRRAYLLECLSTEELDMLRCDLYFHFRVQDPDRDFGAHLSVQNSTISPATSAPASPLASHSVSFSACPGGDQGGRPGRSTTGSLREGSAALGGLADHADYSSLIEFFTPNPGDEGEKMTDYVRKLREKIRLGAERMAGAAQEQHDAQGDWRRKLRSELGWRSASTGSLLLSPEDSSAFAAHEVPHAALGTLGRMPCLGRNPPVRKDWESPTLARVRDVYARRETADESWIEERRLKMEQREAANAFKAHEQQREVQLKVKQQRELHEVRLLETEERKMMMDVTMQLKHELQCAEKSREIARAHAIPAEYIGKRRDKARETLDTWEVGCDRAQRLKRYEDRSRLREGDRRKGEYDARLGSIGVHRHGLLATSTAQENQALKTTIRSSLGAQVEEQRAEADLSRQQDLDTRTQGAAARRQRAQNYPLEVKANAQTRTTQIAPSSQPGQYNFAEKAFGSEAVEYDQKHHAGVVDLRSEAWKKAAKDHADFVDAADGQAIRLGFSGQAITRSQSSPIVAKHSGSKVLTGREAIMRAVATHAQHL